MSPSRKKAPPKRGASRQPSKPARKSGLPTWLWVTGLLAVAGFALLLSKLKPGHPDIKAQEPVKNTAANLAPIEPPKPKYDFYTLLPESQVTLPPAASDSTPPKLSPEQLAAQDKARAEAALNGQTPPPLATTQAPAVSSAPQFYLQVIASSSKDEAERVRAQVLLLGENAVLDTSSARTGTLYRVLVGPFDTRNALNTARQTLSGAGFKDLFLQQRQVH